MDMTFVYTIPTLKDRFEFVILREGTFLIGGVGRGFGGEGHYKNFYKLGRAKPVLFTAGGGSHFFQQGKSYSMSVLLKSTILFLFA